MKGNRNRETRRKELKEKEKKEIYRASPIERQRYK